MYKKDLKYEKRRLRFSTHEIIVFVIAFAFIIGLLAFATFNKVYVTPTDASSVNAITYNLKTSSTNTASTHRDEHIKSSTTQSVHISSSTSSNENINSDKPTQSIQSTASSEIISIININTATIEQLMQLNGIGEVKAQAIIDYRTQNGPFEKIEDIVNVSGIGDKIFEKIKEFICV